MVKKLSGDPMKPKCFINTTLDQIAGVLLVNWKVMSRGFKANRHITRIGKIAFSMSDMKNGKASGMDDLTVKQMKHPGLLARKLDLFNNILLRHCIPKQWCRARVVALLKPGKEPNDPKSF